MRSLLIICFLFISETSWSFSNPGQFLFLSTPAEAQHLGCAEWCRKMHPKPEDWRYYEHCLSRTQAEGKCGSGKSNPPQYQQGNNSAASSNPRCANATRQDRTTDWYLSECLNRPDATQAAVDCRNQGGQFVNGQCQMQDGQMQPQAVKQPSQQPQNNQNQGNQNQGSANAGNSQQGNGSQNDTYSDYFVVTDEQVRDCNNLWNQVKECMSVTKEAQSACEEENNSSLLKYAQTAQTGIDQIKQLQGVAQNTGAIAASCSAAMSGVKAAIGAFTEFQLQCSDKKRECSNACEGIPKSHLDMCMSIYDPRINRPTGVSIAQFEMTSANCNNLDAKIQRNSAYMKDLQTTMTEVQICKIYNSASNIPIPQTCFTNPNTPECQAALNAGNCDSPTMANTPVCACRNGINTPQCQAALGANQKTGGGSSMDLGSLDPSKLTNPGGTSGNPRPDFGDLADVETFQASGGTTSDENVGGKRGSGAGLGSDGNGGDGYGPTGQGGAPGPGINTNISGGYGRGGGGGWGGYGGGSGGDGQQYGNYGSNYGSGTPDLNKFKPNMNAPGKRRNLAGVVGPDGLLGPHASVWQTVKNRYQYEWRQGLLRP